MKFELLECFNNTFKLIPDEFTDDEIARIKEMFGSNLHSKKSYSLYNPNNLLSESCQWHDDVLYVDYGYEKSLRIEKGLVFVNYYRKEFSRKPPISYIPVQVGLWSEEITWDTFDDLILIASKHNPCNH